MLSNNLFFRKYFELQDIDKISECVQLWLLSIFFLQNVHIRLSFLTFFSQLGTKTPDGKSKIYKPYPVQNV